MESCGTESNSRLEIHSGDSRVTRSVSADQLTTETFARLDDPGVFDRLAELLICFWFRRQKDEKNAQSKIRSSCATLPPGTKPPASTFDDSRNEDGVIISATKITRNAQPMPKHPSGALGRRADQYFVYLTKQHLPD
jgi:hypothetical protein